MVSETAVVLTSIVSFALLYAVAGAFNLSPKTKAVPRARAPRQKGRCDIVEAVPLWPRRTRTQCEIDVEFLRSKGHAVICHCGTRVWKCDGIEVSALGLHAIAFTYGTEYISCATEDANREVSEVA